LTTVQGLPKKFDQKKILKVIKKKFGMWIVDVLWSNNMLTYPACNGTIVNDTEMGEVIQLQGDQRKDVQEFLTDKKEGLELDAKTIKVCRCIFEWDDRVLTPLRSMVSKRDTTPRSGPFFPVHGALGEDG
jgi:translation initiation factor 1